MKEIVRIKSSSSSDIYEVTLSNAKGLISLSCTCSAGMYGMICKHRTSLLSGDVSNLPYKSDVGVVECFLNGIEKGKIDDLFAPLKDVEREIKDLNNKKKEIKNEIASKLSGGF